jgi:hypothetical protein
VALSSRISNKIFISFCFFTPLKLQIGIELTIFNKKLRCHSGVFFTVFCFIGAALPPPRFFPPPFFRRLRRYCFRPPLLRYVVAHFVLSPQSGVIFRLTFFYCFVVILFSIVWLRHASVFAPLCCAVTQRILIFAPQSGVVFSPPFLFSYGVAAPHSRFFRPPFLPPKAALFFVFSLFFRRYFSLLLLSGLLYFSVPILFLGVLF